MFPSLKIIAVIAAFVIVFDPPEVESKIRVVRQKKQPKGGKLSGRNEDGTTVKPEAATVAPPATQKPGGKPKPAGPSGGGGSGVTGRPLTVVTQIPIEEKAGFTYLTQHMSTAYYISDVAGTKNDAVMGCRGIDGNSASHDLAGLSKEGGELDKVIAALTAAGVDEAYVNVVFKEVDGTQKRITSGLSGRRMEDYDPNSRKKRSALVSLAERRVKRAGGKNKSPAPAGLQGRSGAGGDSFITVLETQYPWVANWSTSQPGNCIDSTKCKPTICEVTTPTCSAETKECTVQSKGECTVLASGNCSMVCENCKIDKPTCYVKEPQCVVIKDRVCSVTEPECHLEVGDCTVTRPECVSRQPPCNITPNTTPNCTTPEICLTDQAMQCESKARECDENERANGTTSCHYQECTPWAICIKPDYCRMEQVVCPPVETFCPPEIVKCPPPKVSCDEPVVECDEPQIYCPPPTVVCTKPLVNCSAPTVNCPNVVTSCPNPDIDCPPPVIDCPAPEVTCIPPVNPCPQTMVPGQPCLIECTEKCNCVKLKKQGDTYKEVACKCEDSLRYICEGTVNKAAGGGGGGSKPAGPAKKAGK